MDTYSRGEICGTRVVVTLAKVGINGWHIHTTRYVSTHDGRPEAGLCETVKTESEAVETFDRACRLADEWYDSLMRYVAPTL